MSEFNTDLTSTQLEPDHSGPGDGTVEARTSPEVGSILAAGTQALHTQSGMPESPLPSRRLTPLPVPDDSTLPVSRPASASNANMKPRSPKPPTPRPMTGDSSTGSSAQMRSPEMNRPLNVTDALSYLDAVKVQFQDKPEVYNQFLDIMKDFKSQVIDTPGVIQRVSKLFHGNPYLIQGFNTFLPMGYRIEVSADPHDNMITVTTPLGITTQSTNASGGIRLGRDLPGLPLLGNANPLAYPGSAPAIASNLASGTLSRSLTPHALQLAHGQSPFDPAISPGLQNPQTTAAASFLGNLNSRHPAVERQPAGEFNHAIQYLNKIKARYADDPNTYKQFLDILQTYQKEQRHLQDSQVYVQVQQLFKDAPELMDEFKAFLPDAVAGPSGQGGLIQSQTSIGPGAPGSWSHPDALVSSPSVLPAKKATQIPKRKKRGAETESMPVPSAKTITTRQPKKPKHQHVADTGSPSFSPFVAPHSPPQHAQSHAYQTGVTQMPGQHSHVTHSQAIISHGMTHLGNTPADKLLFFDRAKKSLENREVYEEFLKLLNLFSKEIIDVKTLVERTRVFFGDSGLMSEFKELLGWDDLQSSIEKGPPGSIRTGPPEALAALPAEDGEGPSYRRLPDSEIRLACSGRDELCRSVLNDEWVSHPTWASEEAGFVAHKKNSFEEALHKSEEERHEYHVHIEALTRTIALLEPLNARIEEMSNEERTLFKLKSDFGGSSKSIYHRIIKKVYGKESGLEVIQALQDCPSVAVPVVLARLKHRDEEWRRAQREWSRTWREVDSKNFYKSLDHQGISFKQNDKKNITAKYFVADIESIRNQQLNAWEHDSVEAFTRGSVDHQLEYTFHDTSVLLDSLKMVYSFLDRSQAQYSPQERRSVEKFLRLFIPTLCMYPAAEFNAACGPLEGHDDEQMLEFNGTTEGARSGRRSIDSPHSISSGGVPAGDLRKKLLRTAQQKSRVETSDPLSVVNSRAASPSDHRSAVNEDSNLTFNDAWIEEIRGRIPERQHSDSPRMRPFFANTTFYTLLRLLQLLYSRLLMCKETGSQLAVQKHAPLLANSIAVDLGLDDPNGPSAVLAQTMDVLGERGASDNANVVYMYLLNACEKLFDNELDQATFEEHMRWFFGNKAYHLFTLDKLITALVKQVQTVLSDHKCQELWSLLQSAHVSDGISSQDIIRYRREAERHVGQDDHLYRLQWIQESKCIWVSLTGPDDPSVETAGSAGSRWQEYVNTYVMTYPTEWLPTFNRKSSPVYLRRCAMAEDSTASVIKNHMKIRVNMPTYKLAYENGSEDFLWNRYEQGIDKTLLERAKARQEDRKKSRWVCG